MDTGCSDDSLRRLARGHGGCVVQIEAAVSVGGCHGECTTRSSRSPARRAARHAAWQGEGVHECAWFRRRPAASLPDQPPSYTLESGRKAFRHPESRKRRGKAILKTPPHPTPRSTTRRTAGRGSARTRLVPQAPGCKPLRSSRFRGGPADAWVPRRMHNAPDAPRRGPPHAARHGTPHGTTRGRGLTAWVSRCAV